MKRIIKSLACFCVVYAMAALCNQAWAIVLSFEPSASTFNVGDSIDIDIVISEMEFDDLATFDFNINYDDTVLAFDSYALGSELGVVDPSNPWADAEDWSWGQGYLGDGTFVGGGTIHLSEFSWLWDFSSQPDAFTLSTVSFTGINSGISLLSFSNVILGDDWGNPLSADLETGTVSPVPEPATILLLGFGLAAGLVGVGFRKRFQQG
jgi:hypothetical protein